MSAVQFTCNSCVIQFVSSDLQRYHMKTEWHRYNLKRRVAKLIPITADEFAQKLQLSELERDGHEYDEFGFEIIDNNSKDVSYNKRSKSKTHRHNKKESHSDSVSELNQSDSDIGEKEESKKDGRSLSVSSKISKLSIESHETDFNEDERFSDYAFTSDSNYTSTEDELESESDLSEYPYEENEDGTVNITECIYCGARNKEMEKNIKHMFAKHGLYIPERSYLVDVSGLLSFLVEVIVVNHQCLCCQFRGTSIESIRAHMNSKRHCRLPYETRQEKDIFKDFYDFTYKTENITQVSDVNAASKPEIRFKETEDHFDDDIDAAIKEHNKKSDNMELTLPNGSKVGHRSILRSSRQHSQSSSESSESQKTVTAADKRLVSGITEKEFKKGLKKMQQMEKRATDERFRSSVKRMNFQTHYRDELLQ